MGWADRLTVDSVVDADSFCHFAQQELGVSFRTKTVATAVHKLFGKMDEDWATIAGYIEQCKLVRPRPETSIEALRIIKSLTSEPAVIP